LPLFCFSAVIILYKFNAVKKLFNFFYFFISGGFLGFFPLARGLGAVRPWVFARQVLRFVRGYSAQFWTISHFVSLFGPIWQGSGRYTSQQNLKYLQRFIWAVVALVAVFPI
jgi:hypothetical protein